MTTNIHRNPADGYTRRSVEIPPGSRILFISGQTATDENGQTPTDPAEQADIVYAKIVPVSYTHLTLPTKRIV